MWPVSARVVPERPFGRQVVHPVSCRHVGEPAHYVPRLGEPERLRRLPGRLVAGCKPGRHRLHAVPCSHIQLDGRRRWPCQLRLLRAGQVPERIGAWRLHKLLALPSVLVLALQLHVRPSLPGHACGRHWRRGLQRMQCWPGHRLSHRGLHLLYMSCGHGVQCRTASTCGRGVHNLPRWLLLVCGGVTVHSVPGWVLFRGRRSANEHFLHSLRRRILRCERGLERLFKLFCVSRWHLERRLDSILAEHLSIMRSGNVFVPGCCTVHHVVHRLRGRLLRLEPRSKLAIQLHCLPRRHVERRSDGELIKHLHFLRGWLVLVAGRSGQRVSMPGMWCRELLAYKWQLELVAVPRLPAWYVELQPSIVGVQSVLARDLLVSVSRLVRIRLHGLSGRHLLVRPASHQLKHVPVVPRARVAQSARVLPVWLDFAADQHLRTGPLLAVRRTTLCAALPRKGCAYDSLLGPIVLSGDHNGRPRPRLLRHLLIQPAVCSRRNGGHAS